MAPRRPQQQQLQRCKLLVLLVVGCSCLLLGQAFVLPAAPRPASVSRPAVRMAMAKDDGSDARSSAASTRPAGAAATAAVSRAFATASLLLGAGLGPLGGVAPAQAADLSSLPSEVQDVLGKARNLEDPLLFRDAMKTLSEYDGLDELAFDDAARRAVNTELKELQRNSPELWDAETSYYGGVVRRAVNPFHVIELIPLLKVGPFIGGAGYLLAILVQRKAPRFFAFAYFGAIASIALPAIWLINNT